MYVNGDPVNLVDPTGHDAWWQDEGHPGYHASSPASRAPYNPCAGTADRQCYRLSHQQQALESLPVVGPAVEGCFADPACVDQLWFTPPSSSDNGGSFLGAVGGFFAGGANDVGGAVSTGVGSLGTAGTWAGGQIAGLGEDIAASAATAGAKLGGFVEGIPGWVGDITPRALRGLGRGAVWTAEGALSVTEAGGQAIVRGGKAVAKAGYYLSGAAALVNGGISAYQRWKQNTGQSWVGRFFDATTTGAFVAGGTYVGALAGATGGAAVGDFACGVFNVAAVGCGLVGGLVGSYVGATGGARFGGWASDRVESLTDRVFGEVPSSNLTAGSFAWGGA